MKIPQAINVCQLKSEKIEKIGPSKKRNPI
jgi:hypothetical protein